MDGITKIHIENHSRWTISECVKHIAHLMDTESDFIAGSRDKGCTFTFSGGVSIGIFPICPAFPEDTLAFHIIDKDRKQEISK